MAPSTRLGSLLAFTQFEQGKVRSHLIFRCWHKTHARMRGGLEVADEELVGVNEAIVSDKLRRSPGQTGCRDFDGCELKARGINRQRP